MADTTEAEFLSHMKETNPLHWASWVLSELNDWLTKRTDCTAQLHLELPEQRRRMAEAINIALDELDGKTVLGICTGKESVLMRCKPEDTAFILDQIGQRITGDARYILVNVSNGNDLTVKPQHHKPTSAASIPRQGRKGKSGRR